VVFQATIRLALTLTCVPVLAGTCSVGRQLLRSRDSATRQVGLLFPPSVLQPATSCTPPDYFSPSVLSTHMIPTCLHIYLPDDFIRAMATPQDQALCTTCDRVGTMLCNGCKSIHYCSTACQKINWSIHKIICKDYTQFIQSRPGSDHHSAIYFNPAEAQPQFI
jgi:hypothetical protein